MKLISCTPWRLGLYTKSWRREHRKDEHSETIFKAIVHRVDKPNHDFPEMISASIGSGLFVSGITLVMIFDFPNYCASHHINISGDRCRQCHQLVSWFVYPPPTCFLLGTVNPKSFYPQYLNQKHFRWVGGFWHWFGSQNEVLWTDTRGKPLKWKKIDKSKSLIIVNHLSKNSIFYVPQNQKMHQFWKLMSLRKSNRCWKCWGG